MSPKLTAQERLRLIKRVVEGGEKVARVCREAGISRVLFYRWLARYQKGKAEEKLALLRPHKKGEPLKVAKPPELLPQQRLQMIERVKAGEAVAKVCRSFGVSRTIFYRWLKRYEGAVEGQKLEALWDKKPKIEHYWRQTPEKYEQAVLNLVIEHPELSTHKLVEFLPQIGGRSILSNHGVQNVLRRHNLTTFETRMAYSQALRHAPQTLDRALHAFQNLLTSFYILPVPTRRLAVRAGTGFLLGVFAFVIILGARSYLGAFAQAALGSKIGLTFATLSLAVGTFFFLYSLKYYFTLTLVLGFSRQVSGPSTSSGLSGEDGNGNGKASIWEKIFGTKTNGNGNGNGPRVLAGGLQANLDHVQLERRPFVSIHLPLYNEKRVVDRLLTAATSMNYENYEVIVIDDSTDETHELLKKWESHPRVKVIHRPSREGFKGGALKVALEQTDPRAEFVLVFDADFLPYPDTITQFLKYFQVTAGGLDFRNQALGTRVWGLGSEKESTSAYTLMPKPSSSPIAAVQGYQWHVLNKSENWITRGVRSEYAGSYVVERSGAEILGSLKQIAGSVYMIRKDILDCYGWGTSITEDFELTLKLYRDGYKVVYTPYLQAPSECVSTLKRLIRQRMRWAEGHSHNIRKRFWEMVRSSKMTLSEKLEFLYLSPYYLQAALFLIGTFSWFLAEAVFRTRLPFWTSLWGWSLVLTNLFALPLMNTVGLFLEESEERDYTGILSFTALSYLLAPFQGYAAVKGFLEKDEGPWFRTPKTGKITDIFTPGRFARFISGIFGRPAVSGVAGFGEAKPAFAFSASNNITMKQWSNQYLSLATANNRFSNFRIRPKRLRWVSKTVLAILLIFSSTLFSLTHGISEVLATNPNTTQYLSNDASGVLTAVTSAWQLLNTVDSPQGSTSITIDRNEAVDAQLQVEPGQTNTTPGTKCSATPNGRGWILDTVFDSGGSIASGTWSFFIYESDNGPNRAGHIDVCVYRTTVSGGGIGTANLLFQSQGDSAWSTTDTMDGATSSISQTTSSQSSFNIGPNEYLYAEYWYHNTTKVNEAAVTMTFYTGESGANDPNIVMPTITIPENLVFLLAAAPFIPMMVWWLRKHKSTQVGNLCRKNGLLP